MGKQPQAIEIVAIPRGEAPDWVREAWIGLTLPLDGRRPTGTWRTVGVLTGPRTRLGVIWAYFFSARRTTGYQVPSAEAIRLLAARDPAAAEWWRTHTGYGHDERARFIFDAPACRPTS